MKAIVLKDFGGVENLQIEEIPLPEIAPNEVLVETKSISINPVDIKTRSGRGLTARLKEFNPIILGWDISVVVVETGSAVTKFSKGDEVFGMVNFPGHGKAYAQFVAAPENHLAKKPPSVSFEEAAVSTLAALTALEGLRDKLNIKQDDKLLIHAAAGGVGHFAVQLAKQMGAWVIGTASGSNREFVLGIGADEFVDYRTENLAEVVKDVDKVFDSIGGENIDLSLKVMKPGGLILCIPSGRNELVQEKAAAAGFTGMTMMVHSNGLNQEQIAGFLEKKLIKAHISKRFSFEQMQDAHLQIESGRTVGKIVINI